MDPTIRVVMFAGAALSALMGIVVGVNAVKTPEKRRRLFAISASAVYGGIVLGLVAAGILHGRLITLLLLPSILVSTWIMTRKK